MELINTEDKSSVVLFNLCISEGELQIFADTLFYVINTLPESEMQKVVKDEGQRSLESPSETKEFLVDTYEELMLLIQENCRSEFLPARYKNWRKAK